MPSDLKCHFPENLPWPSDYIKLKFHQLAVKLITSVFWNAPTKAPGYTACYSLECPCTPVLAICEVLFHEEALWSLFMSLALLPQMHILIYLYATIEVGAQRQQSRVLFPSTLSWVLWKESVESKWLNLKKNVELVEMIAKDGDTTVSAEMVSDRRESVRNRKWNDGTMYFGVA